MSRTYRKQPDTWRINEPLFDWFVIEDEVVWEDVDYLYTNRDYGWSRFTYYTVKYRAGSKTGKRLLARGRMDKVSSFKEPGPSHFRNTFEERPLRRYNRRELQKFLSNPEYEPLCDAKQRKRIYWT